MRKTGLLCWEQVTGGDYVTEVCFEAEMVDRDETGTSKWLKGGVGSRYRMHVSYAGLCSHVGHLAGNFISG